MLHQDIDPDFDPVDVNDNSEDLSDSTNDEIDPSFSTLDKSSDSASYINSLIKLKGLYSPVFGSETQSNAQNNIDAAIKSIEAKSNEFQSRNNMIPLGQLNTEELDVNEEEEKKESVQKEKALYQVLLDKVIRKKA